MVENSQDQQVNLGVTHFTKEQLEHMYKLFQSLQFSFNLFCSLAQIGNYLTKTLSSIKSNSSYS